MTLDVLFPATGRLIPIDHHYPLFASLSGVVPGFHIDDGPRFAPLTGDRGPEPGTLALTPHSRLRVRVPQDRMAEVFPLAGKLLDVAGHRVQLRAPTVTPLMPAATLAARVVTLKPTTAGKAKVVVEFGPFLDMLRRALERSGIAGQVEVPFRTTNKRDGKPEPCRRIVRVKGKRMVGYAVTVTGLSAADSLKLQTEGLGGRRRMGCGFFLPVRGGGL